MRHESASGLYAWEFEKNEQALRVRVAGQLTFNDPLALIRILDDWSPFFDGSYLYYQSRRQNLAASKIIVDALSHRD